MLSEEPKTLEMKRFIIYSSVIACFLFFLVTVIGSISTPTFAIKVPDIPPSRFIDADTKPSANDIPNNRLEGGTPSQFSDNLTNTDVTAEQAFRDILSSESGP